LGSFEVFDDTTTTTTTATEGDITILFYLPTSTQYQLTTLLFPTGPAGKRVWECKYGFPEQTRPPKCLSAQYEIVVVVVVVVVVVHTTLAGGIV
jgi:hypothetical protein